MNKRIEKRHKRQVARARERVRTSEPDLRTPEEVTAAREVSRSVASRHSMPHAAYATAPIRTGAAPAAESAAEAESEER
jgi:hypothetical protein